MIPAAFEYARAGSVQEAGQLLGKFGEDAKVLAGGHSLIPLMRLRLAQPSALVDINGLKELDYVVVEDGKLRVGALSRHVTIHTSDVVRQNLPLLAEVASEVGDNQVRNMGTIGGVVAHADSAGDYPTLAVILDAEIVTNKRRFAAPDFFQDLKYVKFRRRLFDWAIVAAAAQQLDGGWRIGLTNVGPTPVRCSSVERALAQGATPEQAAEAASDGLNPSGDLRASPEYKKHLARVLTKRAIQQAT